MTKFKRYRDGNGSEFSSAVSDELAQAKGWTDITSKDNPAADRQGKPLPAVPAKRTSLTKQTVAKSAAPVTSKEA